MMDSVIHFTKFINCSNVGITNSSQFKFKYRDYLLKHVIEGNLAGRIDVTGRRDGRRKPLLDNLMEKRRHWKLKYVVLVRNACYHSVQNLLSSRLLSKNLKIKIYKIIILPVVLYGCQTWSLTLMEERRLRVFENRVLRKVFRPKRD